MNMQTKIVRRPERLVGLALLLDRFERDDMENAVELLLAMLDARDGDPEAEDSEGDECVDDRGRFVGNPKSVTFGDFDDSEPAGDERDFAWIERQDQHRAGGREGYQAPSYDLIGNGEDAEDDDAGESGGDDEDVAWVERGGNRQDGLFAGRHEDAERDDPAEASVQPAMTALAAANDA